MRQRMWSVAVLLTVAVGVRADEAAAVKAIEKLGGKVPRDDNKPDRPGVAVDSRGNRNVTDADLKDLKELKQLTTLYLVGSQMTDAGLKELRELKHLTSLDLSFTQVTGAGLKELAELKHLTYLGLGRTQV